MPSLKDLLKTPPALLWPQPPSEKATQIKGTIGELEGMSKAQLREAWAIRYGRPVPAPESRTMLLRLLAWRIQADAFGGHSPEVLRILNEPIGRKKAGSPPAGSDTSLKVDTVLKRDWRGRVHQVVVRQDGFGHEGKTYKTLSEVARVITGTKWSGPRFFGLKDSKHRPSVGAGL